MTSLMLKPNDRGIVASELVSGLETRLGLRLVSFLLMTIRERGERKRGERETERDTEREKEREGRENRGEREEG